MIETLKIALLCRRAGIDAALRSAKELKGQPTFLPSAVFRGKHNQNLVSSAQCAGFGHWGDTAYMLYYASPERYGPYYSTEVKAFHNLTPLFNEGFGATKSLLLTGESYAGLYQLILAPAVKNKNGQSSYAQFYARTRLPFHLAACDDTGAAQLALTARPGWRERVAKLLLGRRWSPPPKNLPGIDGMDGGTPLIVAADMNLKRLSELCRIAWDQGCPTVAVAGLRAQVEQVLSKALPLQGVTLLYFEVGDLRGAFEGPLLFEPEHL